MVAAKASVPVRAAASIAVSGAGPEWVSRAADKLVGAFAVWGRAGLTARGLRCLDVGASTGGFTQVLLRHGARQVLALDVGHSQLVPELAADPRVVELSGTTIRGLRAADLGGVVDLLVADLSFISLTLVVGELAGLLRPSGAAVLLVKPQFEVGRARLGKHGIVHSAGDRAWAITEVARAVTQVGWQVKAMAPSPIRGGTGNAEYLLWATPEGADTMTWEAVVAAADALSLEGGS